MLAVQSCSATSIIPNKNEKLSSGSSKVKLKNLTTKLKENTKKNVNILSKIITVFNFN